VGPLMKVKIAKVECSLMNFGTIVDCYPRICFLCKEHKTTEFKEKDVTIKELIDLIKSFQYVIKRDDGQASA